MFGLGMPELVVILVIALIIFGGGKLPEVGSAIGKAVKGFKQAVENDNKEKHDQGSAEKEKKGS